MGGLIQLPGIFLKILPVAIISNRFFISLTAPIRTAMSKLTNQQKDFFAYTGAFGALLSATCFIQHMVIARDHWIAYTLTFIYAFIFLTFFLLALKKAYAPVLLIVSTVFALLAELILVTHLVFSVVVVLLFLYSFVIVVIMYVQALPRKLKEQAIAERMEERVWKERL